MFYFNEWEEDESFESVRTQWQKICRELSFGALLETARENLNINCPVYVACQDEMNRRNRLSYEKYQREEVRPHLQRRKRENRRKMALKNKVLEH